MILNLNLKFLSFRAQFSPPTPSKTLAATGKSSLKKLIHVAATRRLSSTDNPTRQGVGEKSHNRRQHLRYERIKRQKGTARNRGTFCPETETETESHHPRNRK